MIKIIRYVTGRLFFLTCFLAGGNISVQASESATQNRGDWMSYSLIWAATAHTLWNEYDADDEEFSWANGLVQLHAGALISRSLVVNTLKDNISATRPDGGDRSFPSAHAARSFYPAWYIHKRYGFKQSIPYLAAATYVGYTRVHSKRHYWSDIAASAALTYALNHYLTSSRGEPNQPQIGVGFDEGDVWFNFSLRW